MAEQRRVTPPGAAGAPPPREQQAPAEEPRTAPHVIRPSDKPEIIRLLTSPGTLTAMQSLAPRHLTPERLLRLSLTSLGKTKHMLEVDAKELLGAFFACGALGLEPNSPLEHVALIPFYSNKRKRYELQVIIEYKGWLTLGARSGEIKRRHADVVWKEDLFEAWHGTNQQIRHESKPGPRKEIVKAYSWAELQGGDSFEIMELSDILKIRDNSQNWKRASDKASTPWGMYFDRMARKTVIRRHYSGGEIPLSIEIAGAAAIDERRVDYARLTEVAANEVVEAMGEVAYGTPQEEDSEGRPDDEHMDEETGEITGGGGEKQEPTPQAEQKPEEQREQKEEVQEKTQDKKPAQQQQRRKTGGEAKEIW